MRNNLPTSRRKLESNGTGHAAETSAFPAQETQTRPPQPEYDLHDPIPNLRNEQNDRLAARSAYWLALIDETHAETTALRQTLDVIGKDLPGWRGWLLWWYDHRLLATLRRFTSVCEVMYARLERRIKNAEANNSLINAEQKRIREEAEDAIRPERDALPGIATELARAHTDAAREAARLDVSYNPDDLSGDAVLRVARRPLESVAGSLRIDFAPEDEAAGILHSWPAYGVLGCIAGLGFGLVSGSVDARDLGSCWLAALLWAVTGTVVALVNKAALFSVWGEAAAADFKGSRAAVHIGTFAIAAMVSLVILTADIQIIRSGLLALRDDRQAIARTALVT